AYIRNAERVTRTTDIVALTLHDVLPIFEALRGRAASEIVGSRRRRSSDHTLVRPERGTREMDRPIPGDRAANAAAVEREGDRRRASRRTQLRDPHYAISEHVLRQTRQDE